jgi:hypothetical protein
MVGWMAVGGILLYQTGLGVSTQDA